MSFFNEAIAQTASATGAAPGFDYMSVLPFALLIVVFYFLLIRPQQKRMKEHKAMVDSLKKGDKVVAAGGTPAGRRRPTKRCCPSWRLTILCRSFCSNTAVWPS